MFIGRYGTEAPRERYDEMRQTLEIVVAELGAQIYNLRKPDCQELDSMPMPDLPKSIPATIFGNQGVSSSEDRPLFANL